jgi:hypothetical protein
MFAQPHTGQRGGNRLKRPAKFCGRIRLRVEAINVAATAVLNNEDARLGLRCATGACVGGTQQLRER